METGENKRDSNPPQDRVITRRFLQIFADGKIMLGVCEFLMERHARDSLDGVVSDQRYTERLAMVKHGGRALWFKLEDVATLQRALERLQQGVGLVSTREPTGHTAPLQATPLGQTYTCLSGASLQYLPRSAYQRSKPACPLRTP